jgi:tRNA (guanosine-2'-O-)-methyltransferase
MSAEDKSDLFEFMSSFVSEHKKELFEKILAQRTRHLTVVLENIYMPQNASAVLRTCELLGVQDVHIIEDKNNFELSSTVTKGSAKWLTLHNYSTPEATAECISALKGKGYRLACATPHTQTELHELAIDQPLAICFGTEHTGASKELLEACDLHFKIPMYGFTESYNLSVSAAIVLYELIDRMKKANLDIGLNDADKQELRLLWAKRSIKRPEDLERYYYKKRSSNEEAND